MFTYIMNDISFVLNILELFLSPQAIDLLCNNNYCIRGIQNLFNIDRLPLM